jgi:hypothetical protein
MVEYRHPFALFEFSEVTMTLLPVILEGSFSEKQNKPFIPVGAHWVPAKTALQWLFLWVATDEKWML